MIDTNKYKTARIMAHLTIEKAAEQTYISETTIKRIERGTQHCSKDQAEAMAKVYRAPWVADSSVPDDYKPMPLLEASMRFIGARRRVDKLMDRAVDILGDGQIDATEEADFKVIASNIADEQNAERDLLYAQ